MHEEMVDWQKMIEGCFLIRSLLPGNTELASGSIKDCWDFTWTQVLL
jgi:hypothetical protein